LLIVLPFIVSLWKVFDPYTASVSRGNVPLSPPFHALTYASASVKKGIVVIFPHVVSESVFILLTVMSCTLISFSMVGAVKDDMI